VLNTAAVKGLSGIMALPQVQQPAILKSLTNKDNMKPKLLALGLLLFCGVVAFAQKPCSRPIYRQFDFWIGDWEVFGLNGQKAGDSKISLILDSCIILEEWTSASVFNGLRYAGKSFNTFNAATRQWQQTWVDNSGGTTKYNFGAFDKDRMVFKTAPFQFIKDTMAIRQLTFYNLSPEKVRQHGEISTDNGITWKTEYDLEYRRKKTPGI
jgi:hypothetical protein